MTKAKRAECECLPNKLKALSSKPSSTRKENIREVTSDENDGRRSM
jgi:hypothetical protein